MSKCRKGQDKEYRWTWLMESLFSVTHCPAYKCFIFSHHCYTIYRVYLWSKGTSLPRWCHFGLCLVLANRMWAEMTCAMSELKPEKPLPPRACFLSPLEQEFQMRGCSLSLDSGIWNLHRQKQTVSRKWSWAAARCWGFEILSDEKVV